MNAHKFFLSSVAATVSLVLGATGPAIAQSAPSNEELGKRVDSIETKLDALIDMLAKDHSSTPASSTAASPAESSEEQSEIQLGDDYQKGLNLDLYLVPFADDVSTVIPTPPDAIPSASEHVEYAERFELSAPANLETMKRFMKDMDKRVALQWSGFIKIPSSGQQIFSVEIAREYNVNSNKCIARLEIDDHAVVQIVLDDGQMMSDQGALNLEEGVHKFALWGHCNWQGSYSNLVYFNFLSKGPHDRAPQPIAADRFFTKD